VYFTYLLYIAPNVTTTTTTTTPRGALIPRSNTPTRSRVARQGAEITTRRSKHVDVANAEQGVPRAREGDV